jgi:hypothetical protein
LKKIELSCSGTGWREARATATDDGLIEMRSVLASSRDLLMKSITMIITAATAKDKIICVRFFTISSFVFLCSYDKHIGKDT